MREYLTAGGRMVWVVDPAHQTVTVHRRGTVPKTLSIHDTLDGGSVLPGLRLPVREVFTP